MYSYSYSCIRAFVFMFMNTLYSYLYLWIRRIYKICECFRICIYEYEYAQLWFTVHFRMMSLDATCVCFAMIHGRSVRNMSLRLHLTCSRLFLGRFPQTNLIQSTRGRLVNSFRSSFVEREHWALIFSTGKFQDRERHRYPTVGHSSGWRRALCTLKLYFQCRTARPCVSCNRFFQKL